MSNWDEFVDNNAGAQYPAFKFVNVGDTIRGTVAQRPITKPVPKIGSPGVTITKAILPITTDDGETLAVWVNPGQMLDAIVSAVTAATGDPKGIKVGGRIAIRFDEKRDTGKGNPLHVFVCQYQAPVASVPESALL